MVGGNVIKRNYEEPTWLKKRKDGNGPIAVDMGQGIEQ